MIKSILKFASLPLVLVVLFAGYIALWFAGTDNLRGAADAWITERRAAGWTIEHDGLDVGGFPLGIRVTAPAIRMTAPPESGEWTASADALRLEAVAWKAFSPRLRPVGPLILDVPGRGRWQITGRQLSATLAGFSDHGVDSVSLDIQDMAVVPLDSAVGEDGGEGAGTPAEDAPALTLDRLTGTAERLDVIGPVDVKTATYALTLHGSGLTLPATWDVPFDRVWRDVDVAARVLGPVARDAPLYDMVKTWRDDGGVLEIDRLYADWPPLEMVIAGTLALDDRLQPVGALSTHVRGFFQAVGRLEDADIIRARDATMARVVLGAMAQNAPRDDRGPVLTLPMTVQNRQVSMGPVSLLTVPAIEWGGRPPPIAREVRPGFEIDRFGNILRRE